MSMGPGSKDGTASPGAGAARSPTASMGSFSNSDAGTDAGTDAGSDTDSAYSDDSDEPTEVQDVDDEGRVVAVFQTLPGQDFGKKGEDDAFYEDEDAVVPLPDILDRLDVYLNVFEVASTVAKALESTSVFSECNEFFATRRIHASANERVEARHLSPDVHVLGYDWMNTTKGMPAATDRLLVENDYIKRVIEHMRSAFRMLVASQMVNDPFNTVRLPEQAAFKLLGVAQTIVPRLGLLASTLQAPSVAFLQKFAIKFQESVYAELRLSNFTITLSTGKAVLHSSVQEVTIPQMVHFIARDPTKFPVCVNWEKLRKNLPEEIRGIVPPVAPATTDAASRVLAEVAMHLTRLCRAAPLTDLSIWVWMLFELA